MFAFFGGGGGGSIGSEVANPAMNQRVAVNRRRSAVNENRKACSRPKHGVSTLRRFVF